MTSEVTTLIDNIIHKRKASAEIPRRILENLKNLNSTTSQFIELQYSIRKLSIDTSITSQKLNQLDSREILARITREQQTWEILQKRFNRDTINIGVIGLARQGKSTFLQNVAGLTDEEIPSSDRLPCTSVQSNIYHSEESTFAQIHFYSESSFLHHVINPYYKELGFPDFPKSLREFRDLPLPSIQTDPHHPAKAEAIYKHLRDNYYAHVDAYASLLKQEERVINIPKSEIKKYVSQDYNETGNPQVFDHLAVEKVEIFCPFPEIRIKRIGLVDMPGLGDTRLGDAERMIKALGQDVDFILFIRRPDRSGDAWLDRDVELYDIAFQALKDELPLEKWSFMLLNRDGKNEQQCKDLMNTIASKGIHVKKCLIGNCKDTLEANQILTEILNELSHSMVYLDRQYMDTALRSLNNLQEFVTQKSQETRQAIEGYGDIDIEFLKLKNDFLGQLYSRIEEFRIEVRKKLSMYVEEFNSQVDILIDHCKQQVSIPSPTAILTSVRVQGIDSAYFEAIQEMRSSFLKQFHLLDNGLKQSTDETKSALAEIFIQLGLGNLMGQQDSEPLEALTELLDQVNNLHSLKLGFKFITSFEITYKGLIQSLMWQKINEVLPSNPMTSIKVGDSIETTIGNLERLHSETIQVSQKALASMGEPIGRVHISMIEEFSDYITRSQGVKQEWDIFLNKNRNQVWAQFQNVEQKKQIQEHWIHLIRESLSICQTLKSLCTEEVNRVISVSNIEQDFFETLMKAYNSERSRDEVFVSLMNVAKRLYTNGIVDSVEEGVDLINQLYLKYPAVIRIEEVRGKTGRHIAVYPHRLNS